MKLWTIWIQGSDGGLWLQSAWDDDSTIDDHDGYRFDVDKAAVLARENGGAMRVICVDVPDAAISEAFKVPIVEGAVADA